MDTYSEHLLREKRSDEIDEILSLDHAHFPRHAQRAWPRVLVLLLLSLGWVFALALFVQPTRIPESQSTLFPDTVFGPVKRVFNPDERYIGPSNATHHHWDALVAGHDAIYIANPEEYGLPKGTTPPFHHNNMVSPPPPNFYVVSIMHQMHCLNLIRYHYWQVKGMSPVTEGYTEPMWDAHVDHCFEYLRQAISCGAPFSLEGASPLDIPGERLHVSTVTGWGISHDCLNFEAIRTFVDEQEQRYNATWMG